MAHADLSARRSADSLVRADRSACRGDKGDAIELELPIGFSHRRTRSHVHRWNERDGSAERRNQNRWVAKPRTRSYDLIETSALFDVFVVLPDRTLSRSVAS